VFWHRRHTPVEPTVPLAVFNQMISREMVPIALVKVIMAETRMTCEAAAKAAQLPMLMLPQASLDEKDAPRLDDALASAGRTEVESLLAGEQTKEMAAYFKQGTGRDV
jgi:hypothetical protein